MYGYVLISIMVPSVNFKGSCFGLILGQIINIWLSLGSAFYGMTSPTLELKTTNCTMFDIQDPIPPTNRSTPEMPGIDRPLEFEDIYRMSYNVYPIIGMVMTMLFSVIGSLTTRSSEIDDEIDKDLIHPIGYKIFGSYGEARNDRKYQKEDFKLEKFKNDATKKPTIAT